MRAERLLGMLLATTLVSALCGCASSRAPHAWLPYAQEAQREGYGGWIEVATRDAPDAPRFSGELLAVSDDSVFVMTSAGVGGCALADVLRANLEGYDTRSGDVASMTLVGTLTSISTGIGLILIAPMWIVVGSIASGALSDDGQYSVDTARRRDSTGERTAPDAERRTWKDMRLYARFPQGLPVALDRSQLRARQPIKRVDRTRTPRRGSITEW